MQCYLIGLRLLSVSSVTPNKAVSAQGLSFTPKTSPRVLPKPCPSNCKVGDKTRTHELGWQGEKSTCCTLHLSQYMLASLDLLKWILCKTSAWRWGVNPIQCFILQTNLSQVHPPTYSSLSMFWSPRNVAWEYNQEINPLFVKVSVRSSSVVAGGRLRKAVNSFLTK